MSQTLLRQPLVLDVRAEPPSVAQLGHVAVVEAVLAVVAVVVAAPRSTVSTRRHALSRAPCAQEAAMRARRCGAHQ